MSGYIGLVVFFIDILILILMGYRDAINIAVMLVLTVGLTMSLYVVINERVYQTWSNYDVVYERIFLKLLGFIESLLIVIAFYWLIPEYRDNFYIPYFELIRSNAVIIFIILVGYFILCDYLCGGYDSYYYMCKMLISGYGYERVKNHILGLLLRAYFAPLMFIYLVQNCKVLLVYLNSFSIVEGFNYYFNLLFHLFYTIDVLYGVIGYLFCSRLLGTHIKAVDHRFFSWFIALICYQPFWSIFGNRYLSYSIQSFSWSSYFTTGTFLYYLWGVSILIAVFIYAWVTVVYGLNFSNLTYRNVIVSGPYRLFRHPAYIFKCISYWMISVPFFYHDYLEAFRSSILLMGVCIIYYLRAKTEETFLLRVSPEYMEYFGMTCRVSKGRRLWG